jgi:SAM-dependent methyltransferase
MMTPDLTDRQSLARHRARAAQKGADLFLLDEVILEAQERLIEVNKSFTSIAIVTPWPEPWATAFPSARIVPDDETLSLEPGAHDLVIHGLCLHWANDPVGKLVQCRRALRPDGLLLASLFGGQTLHELRTALAEAEAAITGGLSPRVLPMAEIRDLGGLIQRAGLALPVADGYARKVMYRDLFHLITDLRAMGEQNALTARLRHPTPRTLFAQAAAIYNQAFADPETGRIPATFETLWLTGWAAHDSQQKPLRPGSAVTRLADARNAADTPLTSKD